MFDNSPHRAWSLLSPLPIVVYMPKYDEHIVYWNGILLTHAHALQLILSPYGIHASPEIKRAISANFESMYSSGAFGDNNWDQIVHYDNYYQHISYYLMEHIFLVTKGKTIYESAKLLSLDNAVDLQ